MKTKIVYVIVSDESDYYLEQYFISVSSLRKNSPGAFVILLTDQYTAKTFTDFRKKISETADEIKIIELPPNLPAHVRSRLLKTSFRLYLTGNLLFIDTDTLILKPLNEVDLFSYDIAGCSDGNCDFIKSPYKNFWLKDATKINWPLENENVYFNTGVLFVADNLRVKKFFKEWHKNWELYYKKGIKLDQPTFAKTNFDFNHIVIHIPEIWNCQIIYGAKFYGEAKILHYQIANKNLNEKDPIFILFSHEIYQKIRTMESLPSEIEICFSNWFHGLANPTQLIYGNFMDFTNQPFILSLYKHLPNFLLKIFNKIVQIVAKI